MTWTVRFAVAVVFAAGFAPSAWAQKPITKYDELLKRLPEHANVLMLVDVDGLLDSPYGKRESWREAINNKPTGVLGVSGDAARFAVAAGMDLHNVQERWKLVMLQTHAKPPALSVLAKREGGFVEQLQTTNVAWTPRGFYLMSFPQNIVGFVVPADRQAMSLWLKQTIMNPRDFPAGWTDRALYRANAGSQIVLAVNLAQTVSPKGAEAWLKTLELPSVQRDKFNFPMEAATLAGVKSAFLQIDVTETINGTIVIEFEDSLSLFKPIARDIVLTVLADHGAAIDDLKKWDFEVKRNSISMTGSLTEDAAREILSLASAPRLSTVSESAADAPRSDSPLGANTAQTPPQEPTIADGIKASQRYFASVAEIVATLKRQSHSSRQSAKLWYDRSAKQIDELPLLNVDTELLDWGSQVSLSLREMSSGINYASKDKVYRTAGTANGFYGGYGYANSKAYDASVISKQSNSVLNVQLDERWQALETAIGGMRKKMVGKYKVDF
jgi:hypothetical protein